MRRRVLVDRIVAELRPPVAAREALEKTHVMAARLLGRGRQRNRKGRTHTLDVQDRLPLELEHGRVLAAVGDLQDAARGAVVDQECLVALAAERHRGPRQPEQPGGDLLCVRRREPGRLRLEHAHGHAGDPMRKTSSMELPGSARDLIESSALARLVTLNEDSERIALAETEETILGRETP